MRLGRWIALGAAVGLALTGCATPPPGDTRPSTANMPLGGPRVDDPGSAASGGTFGFDLFSGFRTSDR